MSSPTVPPPSADDAARERSFVETALELSGKSAAESRATAARNSASAADNSMRNARADSFISVRNWRWLSACSVRQACSKRS